MTYEEIKLGDSVFITKTITKEDVEEFAKLSLDINPIHLDQEYGKSSIYKDNIYGVQFHPESVMTPDGRKMIENFLERV